MPLLYEPGFEALYDDLAREVLSGTSLTTAQPGSITRAICSALAKVTDRAYSHFNVGMAKAFVERSSGKFLDMWGIVLGTPRQEPRPARATAESQICKFFVETGTFGDINGAANISVTKGTILSTKPNEGGTRFTVAITTILPSSSSTTYIPVISEGSGTRNNLAARSLIYHNFTNYLDNEGRIQA
ncbi:unnamed protein product, partial [marine sediment metagenome]